jgi:hypothetical protein
VKIKYKKNGNFEVDFTDYFKSVSELKIFIKKTNKFVNVDVFEDRICEIYLELTNLKTSLKSSLLGWFVIGKFNFKYKRPNNLNFWLERGYSIDEFNQYNDSLINELSDSNKNKFMFNKFKFEMIGTPKCKLCGSGLKIEPSIGRYNIICCLNNKCDTNKHKEIESISHLSFLPIDMFLNKNKRIDITSKTNKEYWLLNGYPYLDSINKVKEIKNKLKLVNINSFDYYKLTTDKTDDEITKKIQRMSSLCVDYWLDKGFSLEETKLKISEKQKENSNKLVQKRKEKPEQYSATTHTQLGYWVNKGYSEDESKIKLSERQTTFSKEICVKKYGEEKGLKIFTEKQNKWLNSLLTNGNMVIGYSKISQDLFYKILEMYDINDRYKVYFAEHNSEFKLDKKEGGVWLYDFTDIKSKRIIEFHGDMFHGNPKKYKAGDYPHPFRKHITAEEMWGKDKKKLDVAIENGFEVLVIWDSEYRWGNKQEIIDKCVTFLNKK